MHDTKIIFRNSPKMPKIVRPLCNDKGMKESEVKEMWNIANPIDMDTNPFICEGCHEQGWEYKYQIIEGFDSFAKLGIEYLCESCVRDYK